MRAIERALRPTEQQRASLEALRMRLAGMAQLIISSCPTYPLLGPMGRIAAASDRLDVMLFAVMTMTPALPDFYESLSDKQKVSLGRVIRQLRRPVGSGDRS
jgi:LTXXQ motif family protein